MAFNPKNSGVNRVFFVCILALTALNRKKSGVKDVEPGDNVVNGVFCQYKKVLTAFSRKNSGVNGVFLSL